MYESSQVITSEERKRLFTIFNSGSTSEPLDEILLILTRIDSTIDEKLIATIHHDIGRFFKGEDPEYQESNTKYHNLRHTYAVVLAASRLFHGLSLSGQNWSAASIVHGIVCAYFHDIGLLLRTSETAANGAVFLRDHEERSTQVLKQYLASYPIANIDITDCSTIIQTTDITIDITSLTYRSPEVKRVAQLVASADILAQMADRYYIEQLPYLFQEKKEGGLIEFESAFALMKDTAWFYHNVILKRLEKELGNIASAMRSHFKNRWNLDRDLYRENSDANIEYLQKIVSRCEEHPDHISRYMKRTPPPS